MGYLSFGIEANPVRASLVDTVDDWPWFSHKETVGKIKPYLVDNPPITLPADWGKCVNRDMVDKDLEGLRNCIKHQSPYGTSESQTSRGARLGLGSTLRSIGRPRKQ